MKGRFLRRSARRRLRIQLAPLKRYFSPPIFLARLSKRFSNQTASRCRICSVFYSRSRSLGARAPSPAFPFCRISQLWNYNMATLDTRPLPHSTSPPPAQAPASSKDEDASAVPVTSQRRSEIVEQGRTGQRKWRVTVLISGSGEPSLSCRSWTLELTLAAMPRVKSASSDGCFIDYITQLLHHFRHLEL